MSEPIWTDERIHQQAIAYAGFVGSVIMALTTMRDEYEAALVVAKDDLALAESQTLWRMVARLCTCDYALPPLEPEQHGSDCCYRKLLKVVDERTPTIAAANELTVELKGN